MLAALWGVSMINRRLKFQIKELLNFISKIEVAQNVIWYGERRADPDSPKA
jgi:hypothetical protein